MIELESAVEKEIRAIAKQGGVKINTVVYDYWRLASGSDIGNFVRRDQQAE